MSNSSIEVLDGITAITNKKPHFEKLDLKVKPDVQDFFKRHNDIVGVIHFAASKAVGESVAEPLMYYENNITTLIYMLQGLSGLSKKNFIFSSSCTVYGQADEQIGEEIIRDTCKVNGDINAIALRYFNPVGSHPSAEIGELPIGVPQNLVPFITQTGIGMREQLSVFGGDYPTSDGTCVRDYIHVVDLAKAHVVALQRLIESKNDSNYEFFNLGTGTGSTVLEAIQSFERVSGKTLNYKIVDRREGDITAAYAETSKANNVLGWKTQLTLDDAMDSAWKWEQKIRNK